jgi:hypothetical protein
MRSELYPDGMWYKSETKPEMPEIESNFIYDPDPVLQEQHMKWFQRPDGILRDIWICSNGAHQNNYLAHVYFEDLDLKHIFLTEKDANEHLEKCEYVENDFLLAANEIMNWGYVVDFNLSLSEGVDALDPIAMRGVYEALEYWHTFYCDKLHVSRLLE